MVATCGFAHYFRDEEKITLLDSPVVITDSSHMEGRQIDLFLEDGAVKDIIIIDSAFVKNRDTRNDSIMTISELFGDTIHSKVNDNVLERAWVIGNARGLFYDEGETDRINKVDGKRIDIYMVENKVQEVLVSHQATSVYYIEEERDEAEDAGKNIASGDSIRLGFKHGKVQKVKIMGGVQGKYIRIF